MSGTVETNALLEAHCSVGDHQQLYSPTARIPTSEQLEASKFCVAIIWYPGWGYIRKVLGEVQAEVSAVGLEHRNLACSCRRRASP